jgi:hypothetical protein
MARKWEVRDHGANSISTLFTGTVKLPKVEEIKPKEIKIDAA